MNKKKAIIIEQLIKCKRDIDNLEPNINKCETIMKVYNRKMVEKAVLTKELQEFDDNFILKIVKNFTPKNEKLISDYLH